METAAEKQRDSVLTQHQPQPRDAAAGEKHWHWILLGLGVAVTLAIYLAHMGTTFVDWDLVAYRDILHSTDYLKTTVSLFADLKGKVVSGYYAPLSSVSLMLDKFFIGSNSPVPWFTLFLNILFHCLNGILVFQLMRAVGAESDVAVLAALIFLLHPVQVSSVLWFAQRKGLMATAFYLGAYLAFIRFTRRGSAATYAAALSLFVFAVLAKPTVVVFPVALCVTALLVAPRVGPSLLEFTRHEPASAPGERPAQGVVGGGSRDRTPSTLGFLKANLMPVAPFFLVAILSGLLAMGSEHLSMEAEGIPELSLTERPVIAGATVWFYLAKVLFPSGLSPIYPRWQVDISEALWWLPSIALVGAMVLVWLYRAKIGSLSIWCLLNFLIPLAPVCGLLKFAYLRLSFVADHFLYLPMVGMCGLLAISAGRARSQARGGARTAVIAGILAYLIVCAIQTSLYARAWNNSISLWTYNLQRNPGNWTAANYLGHAFMGAGKGQDAIGAFRNTLTWKQQYIDERLEKALLLERAGNREAAAKEQAEAARVKTTLAVALHNLGNAYLLSDLPAQAAEQYTRAVKLEPTFGKALTNLGVANIAMGKYPDAIAMLTRAVELDPNNFEAHYNLGFALRVSGDRALSDKHFQKARQLRPHVPPPQFPAPGTESGE
ncbi:MAG: tetratricopeptide repeat protein [Desulfomonile tiedjei]|nr:tetratricopeptide repeat protein [Desulfomonile tiedjei]